MSRVCQLLGKKTISGNNRPFSMKATKRTFRPNLFTKRVFNPYTGKVEKMKLSAKAIRTLKKWMREIEAEFPAENASVQGGENVKGRVKKEKLTPKQKKEIKAAAEAATLGKGKTQEGIGKEEKAEKSDKEKKEKKKKEDI